MFTYYRAFGTHAVSIEPHFSCRVFYDGLSIQLLLDCRGTPVA
jgi:hypothetical protein